MSKQSVPDAWDDDWETLADNQDTATQADPKPPKQEAKLSKAERRAKHEQANKLLWESASEVPEQPMFLQARNSVPLQSDFKPTVTVLSRRPPPKVIASRADIASGVAGLNVNDQEDESDEEEEKRKQALDLAERQARAQKEREEKLRRYQEARERILGPSATPQPKDGKDRSGSPGKPTRGKGRGRGGGGSGGADRDRQISSNEHSPARGSGLGRQLYDPDYNSKPNSIYLQKREPRGSGSDISAPNQHVRSPKGPDGSGRGGFGFASRGNRNESAMP